MANLKISQLTGATTPLAGTEVVPLVQSGTTKKVAVSDLTAGRDVAVKKLQPTDNIEMVAGKGIDFTANGGNVLTQYAQGTWTPVDASGAGLTLSGASGFYTRVGRLVTVSGQWNIPNNASTANLAIGGLPFTINANSTGSFFSDYSGAGDVSLLPVGTTEIFFYGPGGVRRTNVNYTAVSIYFSASYIV